MDRSLIIPDNASVYVLEDLTVAEGASLTAEGELLVIGGQLNVESGGKLISHRSLQVLEGGALWIKAGADLENRGLLLGDDISWLLVDGSFVNLGTLEGQIIRHSDRIAYVNHDIDDAVRAGILDADAIPKSITDVLGHTHSRRIDTLVCDMIQTSQEAGQILLSPPVDEALKDLRSFMFEKVYRNPIAKGEESKAKAMLTKLFEYYVAHPEALPEDFHPQMSFDGLERTVCDYIAGMTDNYAVDKYTQIFIPMGWQTRS
jgi:hypothetical protein